MLADPDRVASLLAEEARRLLAAGADCIVLVGAVMADMAARLQPDLPVPVIEGVSCAVALAGSLVQLRLPKPSSGSYAAPSGRATTGLDSALTRLLGTSPGLA